MVLFITLRNKSVYNVFEAELAEIEVAAEVICPKRQIPALSKSGWSRAKRQTFLPQNEVRPGFLPKPKAFLTAK